MRDYLLARLGPDRQHAEVLPSTRSHVHFYIHSPEFEDSIANMAQSCLNRCGFWTKGIVPRHPSCPHRTGRHLTGSRTLRGQRWA